MHESQKILDGFGMASTNSFKSKKQLTSMEAMQLQSAISNDTLGHVRHAALALAEGISGINLALTTWATVQLYYCVFYTARARLGAQNVCIFYIPRSSYSIEARSGAIAVNIAPQTHKATLQEFARRNPNSLFLSQPIGQRTPFEWLCEKREIANYKNCGPFEPDLCESFLQVHKLGLRKALQTYLNDPRELYTFDEDHAVLAFPLRFFQESVKIIRQGRTKACGADFCAALSVLLKDRSGPFTSLAHLFS
jgi:hypothetical protein